MRETDKKEMQDHSDVTNLQNDVGSVECEKLRSVLCEKFTAKIQDLFNEKMMWDMSHVRILYESDVVFV